MFVPRNENRPPDREKMGGDRSLSFDDAFFLLAERMGILLNSWGDENLEDSSPSWAAPKLHRQELVSQICFSLVHITH